MSIYSFMCRLLLTAIISMMPACFYVWLCEKKKWDVYGIFLYSCFFVGLIIVLYFFKGFGMFGRIK